MLVEEKHGRPLHVDEHIWGMRLLGSGKGKRYWHLICMRTGKMWPEVDMRVRCIIARKLDYLDLPLVIERDYVGSEFETSSDVFRKYHNFATSDSIYGSK